MWPVYAEDERAHVGRGAWAGNQDEIPLEGLALQASRIEQVAGPLDDALAGKNHDVQRHEQGRDTDERSTERDANRSGGSDARECFGDTDSRCGQLVIPGAESHAFQTRKRSEKLRREKFGFAQDDAVGTFRGALNGIADGQGRALTAPHRRGNLGGVFLKRGGQVGHVLGMDILQGERALVYAGKAWPRVSAAKGTSSSAATKASEVSATGAPSDP
jgi:hypothetical protein